MAQGSRIAGIALGGDGTTWAYWTQNGGWGARGDPDLLAALNRVSANSPITSIVLGTSSTNWIVFYGNGGYSARGEQQMLDSLSNSTPRPQTGPTIGGFSPTSGPPGTVVTVTGANFGTNNALQVLFGGASLPRTVAADGNSVTFAIPATAQSGVITLTTASGSASTSTAFVVGGSCKIVNLSIRTNAGTGPETLIAGFAVAGTGKSLLVRGIGPALTQFGVGGALLDPDLRPFSGSASIGTNDNWGSASNAAQITATAAALAAFPLTSGGRDSSMLSTVNAGIYTAQVAGIGGGTGVALIEVYDANSSAASRLTNVSARAQVGTGNGILIAGFVIQGSGSKRVLIRGVGPTLSVFGVGGVLADPQLSLFSGNSMISSNNDWGSASNLADLTSAASRVGAFALPNGSRDAAMLVTLQPGTYTAQVAGANNGTGIGLIEVYEVD